MNPYSIRPAEPTDIPLIYSSWLKSYKHDSVIGLSTSKTVFFTEYREVIDNILIKSEILVACKTDEPNVIFAYLVYEAPNIIHYAFTKESFQRLGIQKALIERAFQSAGAPSVIITQITHRTKHIKDIMTTHPELVYNPFILYNKEEE